MNTLWISFVYASQAYTYTCTCIHMYMCLTQKCRFLLAKQFLMVFRRCGGSERKNRQWDSTEYGFDVLYTNSLFFFGACSRNNWRLAASPSHVSPMTRKPYSCKRPTAFQKMWNIWSPRSVAHGNCGNCSPLLSPLTISTSIDLAIGLAERTAPFCRYSSKSAR